MLSTKQAGRVQGSFPAETSASIPPRYGKSGARSTAFACFCLLAASAGGLVLFFFNPVNYAFYPFCTFYRTTGLLCPGCGSLRALHHLLHGHLAEALRFNLLLVLSVPLVMLYAQRLVLQRWGGETRPFVIRPVWLWCGLAVTILFGVLRNLPFAYLAWLAP